MLDKVGLKPDAIEIVFNGADKGPVWKAIEENTLIAHEMNGAPLPHFNGYPARLVLPGWTGTYWMKHLIMIEAVTKPYANFWMKAAYRIPLGEDLGRYAFRPWTFGMRARRGKHTIMARATNAIGQSQTTTLILNPAGYHHNVVQTVTFNAA